MMKYTKITLVLGLLFGGQGVFAHVINGVDTHRATKVHTLTTKLVLGSNGEEVKLLQETLAKVPNIYPEGLVTGYFGALTEKAVKRLQSQNNLEQVGFVGPKTRTILNDILIGKMPVAVSVPEVPMINVIQSMGTSSTTAYVFWTTNKLSTSEFWYSTQTPLASTTPTKLVDNSYSQSHSHNLTGLTPNTTYYYMIKITDERGNSATSTERSLITTSQ